MIVTDVVEYTRGKYKIFLNDEFAFVLYKGELRKYSIEHGCELDAGLVDEIMSDVLVKRARLRALNLLKSRDYTEMTIRNKLKESMYPEVIVDDAVKYVISYGYVDDLRYAKNYVRSHRESRSSRELEIRLREKGVSADIIDSALESEGIGKDEERELIRRLLVKKCRNIDVTERDNRRKVMAFMYSKGFRTDRVEQIMDELLLDITS